MIIRTRRPTPPGEILAEHYLEPRGITISALADAAGLSRKHLSYIVNGRAGVTADTAVRLASVLGTTPQLWLNLQNAVDIWDSQQSLHEKPVKAGLFAPAQDQQDAAAP